MSQQTSTRGTAMPASPDSTCSSVWIATPRLSSRFGGAFPWCGDGTSRLQQQKSCSQTYSRLRLEPDRQPPPPNGPSARYRRWGITNYSHQNALAAYWMVFPATEVDEQAFRGGEILHDGAFRAMPMYFCDITRFNSSDCCLLAYQVNKSPCG